MVRLITVGLDGSPESLTAADWGAREARYRHCRLHLVIAWTPPPRTASTAVAPEVRDLWAQQALEDARAGIATRYPEVPVSTESVPAAAAAALVARGETSQMLVLGSRGRAALVGFLLGSVGTQVLARSTSPVVMVRHGTGPGAGTAGDEVVVGVQDPPESALIEFAFATAAARHTLLRAVRAWAPPPVLAHAPPSRKHLGAGGGITSEERSRLAEAVGLWREKYPEVPVVEQVERGHAAEVLLTAAVRAGLVVVGRHAHRPGVGPRLGHVAHALLHHAPCPVAVVPPD